MKFPPCLTRVSKKRVKKDLECLKIHGHWPNKIVPEWTMELEKHYGVPATHPALTITALEYIIWG